MPPIVSESWKSPTCADAPFFFSFQMACIRRRTPAALRSAALRLNLTQVLLLAAQKYSAKPNSHGRRPVRWDRVLGVETPRCMGLLASQIQCHHFCDT